jgi:hypothetical protein
MEAVVAHGSAIDAPFVADLGPGGQLNWVPTDASGWSRCARTWQGSIQKPPCTTDGYRRPFYMEWGHC